MELKRIVGFVMTTRPEQATAFYRDTLGFTFLKDDGFALVFDAHGSMLRVGKAKAFTPANATILGWEVEDIQGVVAELKQRGVSFERPPGMPLDEHGVCTFPGGDRVAWFKDPEGNLLSVSQHRS
jgi:catechol 2,3-dioxygenase-like lactoylglutathione lyase family enzyme